MLKPSSCSDRLDLQLMTTSAPNTGGTFSTTVSRQAVLHVEMTARQLAQQEHALLHAHHQLQHTLLSFVQPLKSMQQELQSCHQRMQEIASIHQKLQSQTTQLMADHLLAFAQENQQEMNDLQHELHKEQQFWKSTRSSVQQFQQEQFKMQHLLVNVQCRLRHVCQQKHLLVISALRLGLGDSLYFNPGDLQKRLS